MKTGRTARIERWHRLVGKTTIGAVLFLILVGGIVRSTGAGMGCPDWPKCFGLMVPPTEEADLAWAPGKSFAEGQMIIRDEQLLVSTTDFTAGDSFAEGQWTVYTKHDYAVFNPIHTWTEYINRLVGVLIGIFVFLTALFSLTWWKRDRKIALLSIGAFLLTGFEGWLGAKVVDMELAGWMVTVHMLVSLVILAMLIAALGYSHRERFSSMIANMQAPRWLPWLAAGILIVTTVQILLGTQVREEVDTVAESMGFAGRETWIAQLTGWFSAHKVFYFIVAAGIVVLARTLLRHFKGSPAMRTTVYALLAITGMEILFGILLAKLGLPAWLQPLHLVFASLIFALEFGILWMVLVAEKAAAGTGLQTKYNAELSTQ